LIDEVADAMRSRAEYKSLTLTVSEAQNVPEWILSDPAHLRQILRHIIDNAIKFTPQGNVMIRYGIERKSGGHTPPDESQPNLIHISIIDTGIGISPEQQENIFEPFTQSDPSLTRKYGGTGIGLSVVKHSAEMLNGHVTVESQLGQGSTFTFTFPGKEVPHSVGMHLSVEKSPPENLHPVRDASLGATERRIPTACRIVVVERFFYQERHS
jgi:two-component system CheB/CheR fusion protein